MSNFLHVSLQCEASTIKDYPSDGTVLTRASRFKVIYIVNGVYNASTVIIKLALLFQYLRVLEKGSRMYKVSVMMIWIIALWGIVFTIMAFVPAWVLLLLLSHFEGTRKSLHMC